MASLQSNRWISSRQAADVLGVHESSVKRWCNADRLPASRTAGGHRRILFGDLIRFASEEKLDCSLIRFSPNEQDVWEAVELAQHGDLSALEERFFQLLSTGNSRAQTGLLDYAVERGVSVVDVLQYVFASSLHRIGTLWKSGEIETGDEHRMSSDIQDCIHWGRSRFASDITAGEVAIVGCPTGETHVLGAQMARVVLEARGWRVIFLGADAPPEEFVKQRAKFDAALVCLSIIPPRDIATAAHVLETMRQADPGAQYEIVLGGGGLRQDLRPLRERAGRPIEWFSSLPAFDRWLERRN